MRPAGPASYPLSHGCTKFCKNENAGGSGLIVPSAVDRRHWHNERDGCRRATSAGIPIFLSLFRHSQAYLPFTASSGILRHTCHSQPFSALSGLVAIHSLLRQSQEKTIKRRTAVRQTSVMSNLRIGLGSTAWRHCPRRWAYPPS